MPNKQLKKIKNSDRGSWLLVQAFDEVGKKKGEKQVPSKNSGYIVFKDRAVVIFYTNDLAETPPLPIQGCNDESIKCVHGLAPINRWFGNESMHRSIIQVPAIIAAYNIFMNGVDRYDQYRATNAIERKEKRVTMIIFGFLLDASILNAHAIQGIIDKTRRKSIREFRRIVAQNLVKDYMTMKEDNKRKKSLDKETVGSVRSNHILLENQNKKWARCYLCRIMCDDAVERKTIYGCSQCEKAFHVNCFAFYHHENALVDSKRPILQKTIQENDGEENHKKRRNTKITCTSNLGNARLPFPFK